jgi:hypothetical protein
MEELVVGDLLAKGMRIVTLPSGQRVLRAADGKQYNDVAEVRQTLTAPNNGKNDVPQVTRNRLYHEEKVKDVIAELKSSGLNVTTEISFRSCSSSNRCRADVVARDGNGRIVQIIEVKTGDAKLSPNQ